jgi:hypothetical protein
MKTVPEVSRIAPLMRFRIATVLLAMVLGWFAIATIFAETLTPKTQRFPQEFAVPDPIPSGSLADRAAEVAPLRGDLLADVAMARAAVALDPGTAADAPETIAARERALAAARQSLSLAPHASSMWLLVAMLQSRAKSPDSIADLLKMSYLTGPAEVNLIPARLATVAASAASADAELKILVRGDIRLILTRRPDLKAAIVSAARRGSADGKAFIGDVVQSLDPGFAASLR